MDILCNIFLSKLTGVPRSWYKSFMLGHTFATWSQFSQAFLARFGELDTELVFDRFKRLQQLTTVEAYYDEFEKCRGQLLSKIPSLTAEYFMENFIGDLQPEIKGMIRLLEPTTLEQALKLARFYEHTLAPHSKKYSSVSDTSKGNFVKPNQNKTYNINTSGLSTGKPSILASKKAADSTIAKPRPLTYAQREERRQKGLCFYCDKKFIKGHECKKPQNFLMIVDDNEVEDYCGAPKYDEDPGEEEWQGQDLVLTALGMKENSQNPPLQLKGEFINKPVKILIDGGSSLNWMKLSLGKEMQLEFYEQEPITVNLANGDTITSSLKCNDLKWKCNGHTFSTQVWLMELKDWDIILGVEWLSQLGNLHCNYAEQSLKFLWDGQ